MIEDLFEGADLFSSMKADEQTIEAFRKKIVEAGFAGLNENRTKKKANKIVFLFIRSLRRQTG